MRVVCLYFHTPISLHAFAQSCYQFTSQLAIREPGAVFLEIGKSCRLFNERQLTLRLQVLAKRFQTEASIAIAGSPSEALLQSKYLTDNILELPLGALVDAMSPFRSDPLLSQEVMRMQSLFQKLGIHKLGQFKALPAKSLALRFGALGYRIHQVLHEPNNVVWPLFVPPQTLMECIELNDSQACQDFEPLLFLSRQLTDRLVLRLRGLGRSATQIKINLQMEKYDHIKQPTRELCINLHVPQRSTRSLMAIIHDKLQNHLRQQPLAAPIIQLSLEASEHIPYRLNQRDFFHRQEEEQERWNALLSRLWNKLGKEQSFVAKPTERYLPEKSWVKCFDPDDNSMLTSLPYPQRPLRLLGSPRPVSRLDQWLVDQQQRWHISDWQGPERLSGEWWFDDFYRDYYQVNTTTGNQLWVFVNQHKQYFLHGYFE